MAALVWRQAATPEWGVAVGWWYALPNGGERSVWAVPAGREWVLEDDRITQLAGPFPTLEAAKAAAELLYGDHGYA